jgi:hypothetical protein
MGTWKYRKPEPSNVRGLCVLCLTKPQRKKNEKYLALCGQCNKKEYGKGDVKAQTKRQDLNVRRPYRALVKKICDKCGFIPVSLCQLDVHHIDGNHQNNEATNLQTLCANCHRLEHFS